MSDDSKYTLYKGRLFNCPYDDGSVFYHESAVRELANKLRESRIEHYYCEDTWYNCPAYTEEDEVVDGECDCGADKWNAKIDELLAHYKELKDES